MSTRERDYSLIDGRNVNLREIERMGNAIARISGVSGSGILQGGHGISFARQQEPWFWAKLTAKDSSTPKKYSWTLVVRTVDEDFVVPADAVSGTPTNLPAYEINGVDVDVTSPVYVQMFFALNHTWFQVPYLDSFEPDPASIAVKEVDGSPSYTSVSEIRFDSADGFELSAPAAGVTRVDLVGATTTQAGIVTTSSQTWQGDKSTTGALGAQNGVTAGDSFGWTRIIGTAVSSTIATSEIQLWHAALGGHMASCTITYNHMNHTTFAIDGTPSRFAANDGGTYRYGTGGTDVIGNKYYGGLIYELGNISVLNGVIDGRIAAYSFSITASAISVSAGPVLIGKSTSGAGTCSEITTTSFILDLLDDTDASTAQATLGLGTVVTEDTGTSGNTIPFLDGANTWSDTQIIDNANTVAFRVDFDDACWGVYLTRAGTALGGIHANSGDVTLDSQAGMRLTAVSPIVLGSGGFPSAGAAADQLVFTQTTAPTTLANNTAAMWAQDVSGTTELKVMDEAGNITQITSHAPEGPPEFYNHRDAEGNRLRPWVKADEGSFTGDKRLIDFLGMALALEELTGRKFLHIEKSIPVADWNENQYQLAQRRLNEVREQKKRLEQYNRDLDAWFRLPAEQREVTPPPPEWTEPILELHVFKDPPAYLTQG